MPYDALLTDKTYILYCAQHYDNPNCHDIAEFYEDLKHVKYIKKLLTRYEKLGDLKERLILNHIITLNNLFSPEHCIRILFLKIPNSQWKYIKPFFIFLDMLPTVIRNVKREGYTIHTDLIPLDSVIVERLRGI